MEEIIENVVAGTIVAALVWVAIVAAVVLL